MNRRGFLKSILAAGVAPYVVTTAGVLMPVRAIAQPNLVISGMHPELLNGHWHCMTATEVLYREEQSARHLADMLSAYWNSLADAHLKVLGAK